MADASLNFPIFTNTRVAWADVAALNNFFSSITVPITAANLPAATVDAIGGLKQIEIGAPVVPAVTLDSLTEITDDGATVNIVPTYASYQTLVAQVAYLKLYVETLYQQLNAQGYVGS